MPPRKYCNRCKLNNHYTVDCRWIKRRESKYCDICDNKSHNTINCWSKKNKNQILGDKNSSEPTWSVVEASKKIIITNDFEVLENVGEAQTTTSNADDITRPPTSRTLRREKLRH